MTKEPLLGLCLVGMEAVVLRVAGSWALYVLVWTVVGF